MNQGLTWGFSSFLSAAIMREQDESINSVFIRASRECDSLRKIQATIIAIPDTTPAQYLFHYTIEKIFIQWEMIIDFW